MQKEKTEVGKQSVAERTRNFDEVSHGYTAEQAVREARRCLRCRKKPCVAGCPVEIDIPAFITAIANGDFARANDILLEKNSLPAVCGRVCPQETQCEELCTLGKKFEPVAIGRLERFAADRGAARDASGGGADAKSDPPTAGPVPASTGPAVAATGPRVAVIGAGPAGLTCAAELAKGGARVTLYEALHLPGGVLSYGIPEFRLPKAIVAREVEYVRALGVDLRTDVIVGRTLTRADLAEQGFSAVFIGSGAGLPSFLGIPGENLLRVSSANEFLTRVNLMKGFRFPEYDTPVSIGRRVAVIGGGNVAMDAARSALRLGAAHVSVLYRRTEAEMPARREEYENAVEEGIDFQFLVAPLEFVGDGTGAVCGVRVIRNTLGEPGADGRRRPVPIPGSETVLSFDTVVVAIGQSPHPLVPRMFPELRMGRYGNVAADPETGETSITGVFAGGDIATGAATVISAMGAGKKAAKAILKAVAEGRVFKG